MNLLEAEFGIPLRISDLSLEMDQVVVLAQIGLAKNDLIEKIHQAPLRDPLTVRVGQNLFSLRREICRQVQVEKL